MSSKPSTSKTTKLPPPNTILTRHKTNLMKRQLRNKDESVRKISQITQLLRSPTKEKSKVKKVNSPKMKKDKPEDKNPAKEKKKKKKKKVKNFCLKPKVFIGSTKRKLNLSEAGPIPTKRLKKSASPSVQELVLLSEEQDLDDEDLLEILTCDSPVWWEDPPDPDYIEDAILTKSDMEQDSDSDFIDALESSSDSLTTKTEEIQPTNFKIPHTKQVDDKFMKKRRKLEDLLGNIKSKTSTVIKKEKTDLNENKTLVVNKSTEIIKDKEDMQLPIDDMNKQEISSVEDIKESIKQNIIEDRCDAVPIKEESEEIEGAQEYRRKKTSSTSTDEDPFLALRNEDILNDLQNMNIPIGNDSCSPDVNIEELSKDTEDTDTILETDKDQEVEFENDKKETVDETINETSLPSNTKPLIDENKLVSNTESQVLDKTKVIEANYKDSSEISEKSSSNLAPEPTFSITSIEKESLSPISLQSIPDASSAFNVDTISDTNIQFIEDCSSISSKASEISKNDIKSEYKSDKVYCEKEVSLLNKDSNRSSNEEVNTDKNNESNTDQNKESNTVSNKDKNKDSSEDLSKEPKTYSRKDRNSELNKESSSDPSKDSSTSSSKDSNKEDQIPESKTKSNKEDQKPESKAKSKNFNREQLMAVYKIITNEQYKDSLGKNIESKSNKNEALKNKTLNKIDSLIKKCSDPQITKPKAELSNIIETETIRNKKSEENSSNLKENRKSPCLKCKNRNNDTNSSLNIVSNGKSAKYCLKCSSIFETETCNYCAKKEKLSNNDCQCK